MFLLSDLFSFDDSNEINLNSNFYLFFDEITNTRETPHANTPVDDSFKSFYEVGFYEYSYPSNTFELSLAY